MKNCITKNFFIHGKKLNLLLILANFLLVSFLSANIGLASTADQIGGGFNNASTAAGYRVSQGFETNRFAEAWSIYINGFFGAVAALFVIILIYSGFLWLTAHGKEEQVVQAKARILQAVIGLAIIIAARILVELVFYYLGNTIGQAPTSAG